MGGGIQEFKAHQIVNILKYLTVDSQQKLWANLEQMTGSSLSGTIKICKLMTYTVFHRAISWSYQTYLNLGGEAVSFLKKYPVLTPSALEGSCEMGWSRYKRNVESHSQYTGRSTGLSRNGKDRGALVKVVHAQGGTPTVLGTSPTPTP